MRAEVAGEKTTAVVSATCRRLLADRYGVSESRWIVDRNIRSGVTRVENVERWLGYCELAGVCFSFDMYCTPDRSVGDVLLFDHRTELAVGDTAALAASLSRGGASLGGILERRQA